MTVRPALFSASMVMAILQDRKKQTRRARVPWQAGDLLYVRETLSREGDQAVFAADRTPCGKEWIWKRDVVPTIHMPRSFSRITLRVTDVRGERLQDITEADAYDEGVVLESADPPFWYVPYVDPMVATAVGIEEKRERPAAACYGKLWNVINGPGAWEANPMVAVVTFETIKANVSTVATARDLGVGRGKRRPIAPIPSDDGVHPGLAL